MNKYFIALFCLVGANVVATTEETNQNIVVISEETTEVVLVNLETITPENMLAVEEAQLLKQKKEAALMSDDK